MRITRVHAVNFRCLKDLDTSIEDVTVLVGANSTGKSTLLHALEWFFDGGRLEPEDHAGHQPDSVVSVGVTFSDFNPEDREALGSYATGNQATFWRTWSAADGQKLTGKGRAYPAFNDVRRHEKATPKREAYRELAAAHPELGLPRASSAAQVDAALEAWEADHPDQLEESRIDATHLFGFTGGARLNGRFDFVLVPAISDPSEETRDARGTLLRQLLDRALGEQSQLRERLEALEAQVSRDMHSIVIDEGGQTLAMLATSVSEELARLVPGGSVLLEPRPPAFRVPELSVDLRVEDGGLATGVGRQGHGFQRALLIAVVQQLASLRPPASEETDDGSSSTPPALFLTLEEPELYQHPLQARHFAATLAKLASESESSVQVAYATHSEHFVDPSEYRQLRRFQRRPGRPWPEAQVTEATVDHVAERLRGAYDADQVPVRVRMTLRRQVAEAVFAKAVLIVEGRTDAGLLHGVADREGGFDAVGVSIVAGSGKRQLLIPWAILTELGIPTFVVFDADGNIAERCQANGKSEAQAKAAQEQEARENAVVLKVLDPQAALSSTTTITKTYAMLADTLETEARGWSGFEATAATARDDLGDWREKSEDAYRQAAASVEAEPPEVFRQIVSITRGLAA